MPDVNFQDLGRAQQGRELFFLGDSRQVQFADARVILPMEDGGINWRSLRPVRWRRSTTELVTCLHELTWH